MLQTLTFYHKWLQNWPIRGTTCVPENAHTCLKQQKYHIWKSNFHAFECWIVVVANEVWCSYSSRGREEGGEELLDRNGVSRSAWSLGICRGLRLEAAVWSTFSATPFSPSIQALSLLLASRQFYTKPSHFLHYYKPLQHF